MMAVEKLFVKEGIKGSEIQEYLASRFDRADYSHAEIQRTPLGTRIIVFAHKPGLVIGRSGRKLQEITEEIKERFGLENPLVDVREVEQPFLDANIVARRIAKSLERGINYKKVANFYLDKVMEAKAVGVQIQIGGKLGGEKARFQKFKKGFIAHSGDYSETLVDRGMAQAMLKPGIVGVQVKIMLYQPEEYEVKEKEYKEEKEIEKKEEKVGDSKNQADKADEA